MLEMCDLLIAPVARGDRHTGHPRPCVFPRRSRHHRRRRASRHPGDERPSPSDCQQPQSGVNHWRTVVAASGSYQSVAEPSRTAVRSSGRSIRTSGAASNSSSGTSVDGCDWFSLRSVRRSFRFPGLSGNRSRGRRRPAATPNRFESAVGERTERCADLGAWISEPTDSAREHRDGLWAEVVE